MQGTASYLLTVDCGVFARKGNARFRRTSVHILFIHFGIILTVNALLNRVVCKLWKNFVSVIVQFAGLIEFPIGLELRPIIPCGCRRFWGMKLRMLLISYEFRGWSMFLIVWRSIYFDVFGGFDSAETIVLLKLTFIYDIYFHLF